MSFEPLFSHWQNGAGGRCEARGTVFEKAFCKTEMTMQKTKVIFQKITLFGGVMKITSFLILLKKN